MCKTMKILCPFLTSVLFCCCGCFEQSSFINTLPEIKSFSPEKYAGRWYEIGRLPHSFEKGLVRVTAEYTLRSDGKIEVRNAGYKEDLLAKGKNDAEARSVAHGKAKILQGSRKGHLKVSFFGPFYADYVIIALDDQNYHYAMVASSSNAYLWILSRTPVLDEKVYNALVSQAAALGYDTSRIIKVHQQ